MKGDALADARRAGIRVEIAMLPHCKRATLVAEYDRSQCTIRVDAASLARVHAEDGDDEACALLAAAVAHELYHHEVAEGRLRPASDRAEDERAAHRFAREVYSADPERFERRLLR